LNKTDEGWSIEYAYSNVVFVYITGKKQKKSGNKQGDFFSFHG